MSFPKNPCNTDEFWYNESTERLKNPYISKKYRERLEAIRDDSRIGMGLKITNGHYPRERK